MSKMKIESKNKKGSRFHDDEITFCQILYLQENMNSNNLNYIYKDITIDCRFWTGSVWDFDLSKMSFMERSSCRQASSACIKV